MQNLHTDYASSSSCQPTQTLPPTERTVQARDRPLPPYATIEESLQAARVVWLDHLATAEQRQAASSLSSCQHTHAVAAAPPHTRTHTQTESNREADSASSTTPLPPHPHTDLTESDEEMLAALVTHIEPECNATVPLDPSGNTDLAPEPSPTDVSSSDSSRMGTAQYEFTEAAPPVESTTISAVMPEDNMESLRLQLNLCHSARTKRRANMNNHVPSPKRGSSTAHRKSRMASRTPNRSKRARSMDLAPNLSPHSFTHTLNYLNMTLTPLPLGLR